MFKLVYISGPYTADSHLQIEANINSARNAAIWCAEHGVYFVCPHLNSSHFELWAPKVPVEFYYGMDLRIAEACDAVLMISKWDFSRGAIAEYHYFAKANKPIFYWPDEEERILNWYKENK